MSTNSHSRQLSLAALGLLLLATSCAVGQERYGTIKGHVADHSNNALPGASVRVDPGNATAVTDREGGFLYPHTQIDAQASYTFKNGFQVIVSALNLNNEVFGFYVGSPQWNIQREFYGPTIGAASPLTPYPPAPAPVDAASPNHP